jgi:hypothetical protein
MDRRLTQTPYKRKRVQQKRLRSFFVPEPLVFLRQIIAALAEAFLLVVSCFHLPAARALGRDRLRQARHLVAAAAGARAVVAERERPAFFLVGRALHPRVRYQPDACPVDEIRAVDRRHVARVQQRQ